MPKIKDKCFYDVKKTLFVQNEAADLILKYSKKNKRATVIINNNKPIYIYHAKYKKSQIMRDESNTKWCKYVEKKIKKEINKSSYKKSYIITLFQGYSVDDLDTSNINIHVKKTLELESKMVFAYLTPKDMIKLENRNSDKIRKVQTDSYVNTPEQIEIGYPKFAQSNSNSNSDQQNTRIPCGPGQLGAFTYQDPDADNPRSWIGQRNQVTFIFPQEENGTFNPNVVYLFIMDTGIARHNYLAINRNLSRNFVPRNNGNVDPGDFFDRNGHGTHVAGTAAGRNVGVAATPTNNNQVISIKVLADDGSGGLSTWIYEGQQYIIQFAREHANANIVVNMSLGGSDGLGNIMNDPIHFNSPDRIVVVCAAGNTDQDVALANVQPANSQGSIVVGNSAGTVTRRCNSNYGPRVDIFAPGTNIRSTWIPRGRGVSETNNNDLNVISGTSMAAPAVAGVATFILAYNNTRNNFLRIDSTRTRLAIIDLLNCLSNRLSCRVRQVSFGAVYQRVSNLCDDDPRMNENGRITTRRVLYMGLIAFLSQNNYCRACQLDSNGRENPNCRPVWQIPLPPPPPPPDFSITPDRRRPIIRPRPLPLR